MRRNLAHIAIAASLLVLGGCANFGQNPRDPLEPMNREVTRFNDAVDSAVLKPVATTYRDVVPAPVRTGVSNFFGNLSDAWSAFNSALQFRFQDAEESLARFQINSTAGLFGIMDVASDLNIERHKEDFGQTLGRWGVPAGPYVVLPLLGPSTMRDTLVLPVESWGDLTRQVNPIPERNSLYLFRAIDARANLLQVGNVIDGAALDRYSFTREAYLQKRRADVLDDRADRTPDGRQLKGKMDGDDGRVPREGDDGRVPQEDGKAAPPETGGQIPKEDDVGAPKGAPGPAKR